MINERRDDDTTAGVAGALSDLNEKKRICKMCLNGQGKCVYKGEFQRNFRLRHCENFKLRKEGLF